MKLLLPRFRTLLLLFCSSCVLASVLHAAQGASPLDLSKAEMDASGRLTDLRPVSKKDVRDNVALFGHRPTLLVTSTAVEWRESKTREYVKSLRQLDKLASKWRRDGFDVLYVAQPAWIFDSKGGKPTDLELVKKAKPKNMFCARAEASSSLLGAPEPVLDWLQFPSYTKELEFRWALIVGLGEVSDTGADVFDKGLEARRKELELPALGREAATKRIFAAINEWRLGDASEALTKLENGGKAEEQRAAIDELRELLERSEQTFRRLLCEPHRERGHLPEFVSQLARLGEIHFGASPDGERIAAEVAELKATGEYERAKEFQVRYLELLAGFEAAEEEVSRVYEERVGKNRQYDELKYHQVIVEIYPHALDRIDEYVRTHADSPYKKELAALLVDAREDLDYARELVGAGG